MNFDGRCGHESTEYGLQPTPRRIQESNNEIVRTASAGYMHILVVNTGGHVYAFGSNVIGQLGLGCGDCMIFSPEKVDAMCLFRIESVAAGSMHSLALTDAGQGFSWGYNEFYQLSHPIGCRSENGHVKVCGLDDVHVPVIIAGGTQSGALSASGILFTRGFRFHGSLGHDEVTTQQSPKKILRPTPAVAVSIDSMHGLAITSNGNVYA